MQVERNKVSIIVPIYNTEKYLEKCLDSIKNQTHRNIEIILVNDGSTDSSANICRRFLESDYRAKFLEQDNAGVAAARNLGLKHATGDFIIHADSDDALFPDAIENLVAIITRDECDIAIGSYVVRHPNYDKIITIKEVFESETLLEGLITNKYHGSLWNKLISRQLYEGLNFVENLDYMEDKLILAKILTNHEIKIGTTERNTYIYNQHSESYTNQLSEKSLTTSILVMELISDLVKNKFPQSLIQNAVNNNKFFAIINTRNPIDFYQKHDGASILSDSNISIIKKLPIWGLSKNSAHLLKFYNLLRRSYQTIRRGLNPRK